MSDTISRAKAIEALKNDMASLDHIIKGMSANDVRLDAYVSQRNQVNYDIYTINNLPPAPGANLAEVDTDAISRQAAIDYFVLNVGFHDEDGYPIEDTDELRKIWTEYFDGIPSAQPDIVRCKDCKHHWMHKCMDSMPVERCDLEQTFYDAKHDFCSRGERREVTT